jgi:predicted secreted protein
MMTGYGDNRFEVELNSVELDLSRVEEIVMDVLDANLDTEEEGPTHFEVEIEEDMETE